MKVLEVFIVVPTIMGDTLVSLLKNEEYPRKQEVAKGKQQILKKQFCGGTSLLKSGLFCQSRILRRNGTARDNPH